MRHSAKYVSYIQSKHWRNLRNRVLWRDRYVCQECFSLKATEGHHLTYTWVDGRGYSLAHEVISLCHWCHMDIHGRPYKEPRPKGDGRLHRCLCEPDNGKERPRLRAPRSIRLFTLPPKEITPQSIASSGESV